MNLTTFSYKEMTVSFKKEFKDNDEFAYECFIEAIAYELENDIHSGISKLLLHFKRGNIWYMDILYATSISSSEEKVIYKQALDEIKKNIDNKMLNSLICEKYMDELYEIMNGSCKEIERYLHNYTSVDIPDIVSGKNSKTI